MKKKSLLCAMAIGAMVIAGCGTQTGSALTQVGTAVLGNVLGNQSGVLSNVGQAAGNILQSVLGGSQKPTLQQLIGTWTYSQPGCAFTSEQFLAQAGGEVVAADIKNRLKPTFQTIGITSANTQVTFNQNGTYSARIAGHTLSGNFTYDESNQKVTMRATLLNITCYAKRNSDGIALLFEASKLLTLLQTISALSGNTTLQTVSEIAGNYDGMRIGFDFRQ
ncbi:MAG: DUF4923 family protein [Prevotella sp.]|nr:DUF4923 family protein [Prevotella sp.]